MQGISPAFQLSRVGIQLLKARSSELTHDYNWEKQVMGHGLLKSAGGTEAGERLLPATTLSPDYVAGSS